MNIGIVGCGGRMGRMLARAVLEADGVALAGGTERAGHEAIGADIGTLAGDAACGLAVSIDAEALFERADTIIDFTTPGMTTVHAGHAAKHGTALVVGTTGLSGDQHSALEAAAGFVPIVLAPNMSVGINLLLGLTTQVAAILGPDYDIEIVEIHHRHKVDAPSGTALALGHAAATGRGVPLDSVSKRARDGQIGGRPTGEIGFATLRGGDIVGEHTVIFAGDGERIEITHKASSRAVFARGAVRAAQWTAGRPPGLYSVRDVLGLG